MAFSLHGPLEDEGSDAQVYWGLGGLLEPRRRETSSELLAALNCVKFWAANGVKNPQEKQTAAYTDDDIYSKYHVREWETQVC